MLLVLFKIGEDSYAINTESIVEIIPSIKLRHLTGVPDYIAGVFDYRGKIVPVVDINIRTIKKPVKQRLSTRIILLRYPFTEDQQPIVGIMGEGMTDIIEIDESKIQEKEIKSKDAPHLGALLKYNDKFIQCINIENILTKEDQENLFSNKIKAQ